MKTRVLVNFPVGLVLLRFALCPIIITLYVYEVDAKWYIVILTIGFLSDLFDGIIARKLNISTDKLRSLDSWADTAFYSSVFIVSFLLYPDKIADYWIPISILIALELVRHIFDQIKFKKSASYHMWSSKIWGIFLYLGFMQLLGFGQTGTFFVLAIYIGIATDIEGLLASIVLSKWYTDVPSILHAIKIEKANNLHDRNY